MNQSQEILIAAGYELRGTGFGSYVHSSGNAVADVADSE